MRTRTAPTLLLLLILLRGFSELAFAETLLIADKTSNALLYFETEDARVVRTVPVAENPHEVVVTVDGRLALTANSGSNTVSVIDLEAARELKRLESPFFAYPHGLAAHPNGRVILLTSEEKGLLLSLDVATLSVTEKLSTGMEGSHMVVLSPSGEQAYVSNRDSGTVSMFRTAEPGKPIHARAGKGAEGIALSPDGRWLLVANRGDNDLFLYDAPTLELAGRLTVGDGPVRVACSPDGKRALVSHRASHQVHVIDLFKRETQARVMVGRQPGGMVFSSDGTRAFIANTGEGSLSILDMRSLEIVGTHPAGASPDGMATWAQSRSRSTSPGSPRGPVPHRDHRAR